MKKIILPFCVIVLLISAQVLKAQNSSSNIYSERPGVTKDGLVVPGDFFQIESGVVYQDQKYPGYEIENLTLGSTIFRYGINDKIELRFGGEFFSGKTILNNTQTDIQGLRNVFIGSKFQLLRNDEIITNAALITELGLPFGNENLRHDGFDPKLILTAERFFSGNFLFRVNLSAANDSKLGKNIYGFSFQINCELSRYAGIFAEYFSNITGNEKAQNNLAFGFVYLVRKNILADCSAGRIVSTSNANWFGKFGVSVRLPD